jgi:pimeloyl-ACP methyl ester carboxylesterase
MMVRLLLAWFAVQPATAPAQVESRVPVAGAELAVTLALPAAATGAKVPAVLILPGSGPSTRPQSRAFAEPFLRQGLAVLTFDKRGCGESTGSWLTSSLDDMARDGRVLLDWLKSRPEIDGTRLGLMGVSQGGWTAPLAAMNRQDVTFLVALTGGGVSPRAIERFDYERRLQDAGVSGPDLQAARRAIDAYFSFLKGDVPQSAVTTLLESGKDRSWPTDLGMERVLPSESQRPAWSWVATFEPGPSIEALTVPTLVVIGGRDRDPAVEVKAWQDALAKNPDPRTEIRVVPGAGHVLTVGGTHMQGIFNTAALDAMAAWAAAAAGPSR